MGLVAAASDYHVSGHVCCVRDYGVRLHASQLILFELCLDLWRLLHVLGATAVIDTVDAS